MYSNMLQYAHGERWIWSVNSNSLIHSISKCIMLAHLPYQDYDQWLLCKECMYFGKSHHEISRLLATENWTQKWPWRYRSRSKVITCDTPSHASDHLYQIWKESIQNCRRYRADTIFKAKAKWLWRYRSRSKVITCDTLFHAIDHLYLIWKESILNCRCYRADTKG